MSPAVRPERIIDPAISQRDIRFDPRGHLLVDVHNLGNTAAENVTVTFYDGRNPTTRQLLGQTIVSHLAPPNQLVPHVVRTGIEWVPSLPKHEICVVLDEADELQELFERNNEAYAVFNVGDAAQSAAGP